MTGQTINNDMTMGSGATGTLLAGRYRVVRQLGQGGMGSVWLAEDTKLDGFKVAIKMLPSVLVNNKRAYAQVKAEALVSLKLVHQNIVPVRAFEEEGGSPFLVMDYIDGQTLDDYLAEKGKLTEEDAVKLLKPVAAALDYAHTQGVVHRDVKPGNIMIRKDGTPFVLDFGIAREIQETMTRVTGKLSSGTLMYMSPEQLHGAAPKPAQDIYSFAAMIYECLTGIPPFRRGQIEYQIEHDTPELLDPRFVNCGSGVMAGLAKSSEERPATCAAVLSVGAACGKRCDAGDGTSTGKTRIAAALLVVLSLAAGGGWWWRERAKIEEQREKNEAFAAERMRQAEVQRQADEARLIAEKAEVERKAEEVRLAAEKADAERKARAEAERKAKLEAERIAEENRKAKELMIAAERAAETEVFRLSSKAESAHALIERETADVKAFFEAEIRAFENDRRAGDDAKRLSKNIVATNFFVQALVKAKALKSLVDGRASCQIAKTTAERARKAADEMNAGTMLVTRYGEAKEKVGEAARAAEAKNFERAKACYEEASDLFVALRDDIVKATLDLANDHKSAERWQDCLALAEKVLGWEPENAAALALKREAESHLVPTLRIVAKIGGREVSATAMLDGKPYTAPWRWEENVKLGSRIPSSDVAVEYSEGGKRYMGTIKPVTVDWKGPRTVVVTLTEYKGPEAGDTKTIALPGGVPMTFCWCPATTSPNWKRISGGDDYFLMGSPEEEKDRDIGEKQHKVTLTEGFWMGKYEVTQRQWESVMGSNPSNFKGGDRPVEMVSWDDCQEFIQKINALGDVKVSLPTEAQWEYACRAGTTGKYAGELENVTWYWYNSGKTTHSVGKKQPNAWGLYDMHGNVREWCADWHDYYRSREVTDPTGPTSRLMTSRVVRGGSCNNNLAESCRSAYRSSADPDRRSKTLGLRLVCSAEIDK